MLSSLFTVTLIFFTVTNNSNGQVFNTFLSMSSENKATDLS